MKFIWHHAGRGMALYYDEISKRIYGRIVFDQGDRNYIVAEYVGPQVSKAKERKGEIIGLQHTEALGIFFEEKAAKEAVSQYVDSIFPAKKEELAA